MRRGTTPARQVEVSLGKLAQLRELRDRWYAVETEDAVHRHGRYRRDPVAWARDVLGVHLWSKQADIARAVVDHRQVAVQSAAGIGKALELGTVLPTPDGWTTMGDVQVGDQLLDEGGKPVRVTAVSGIQRRPTYRVVFDDRSELIASDSHKWQVLDRRYSSHARAADWRDHWATTVTKTTEELAASLTTPNGAWRWRIPTARPIEGATVDLAGVGPYTLGAWLGDGVTVHAAITCGHDDAPEILGHIEAEGTPVRARPSAMGERSGCWGLLGLQVKLRTLGVLHNKHIPERVFRADVTTRLSVLQGLMDTDGFVSSGQSVGLDLCNERLAADAAALVRSFGWKAFTSTKPSTIDGRVVGTVYRLQFRPDMPVFRLRRKAQRLGQVVGQASRHTVRTIVAVEPVDTVPTKCVMVDSPSHLYLAGESYIPTHNSFLAAVLALWFGSVHPANDTKVVTTAPSADQVSLILWGEIRKHHDAARLAGRVLMNNRWMAPDDQYVIGFGRKPPDYARSAFQGAHAAHMLIIVDEAGGIAEHMWANIRAIATGADVTILAIGNPDDASSLFHEMCTDPGVGWHVIKVSVFDTPNFTGETVPDEVATALPSRESVEMARLTWGEHNPYYQAKILGEWGDAEDGLIPLAWLTQAVARWRDWHETEREREPPGRRIFGVDVARFGTDKTVIAARQGEVVYGLETFAGLDNVEVADLVERRLLESPGSTAVVDADGLGGGVVDVLRHRGRPVVAFSAGAGTRRRDATGTQRFMHVRSAAWWHLRELLNPALGSSICLPDHPKLIAELAAPKWPEDAGNVIQIERKDHIRKRLGRSTDHADAVVQAFWVESPPEHENPVTYPLRPAYATYESAAGFEAPAGMFAADGGIDWS
jgi:hypothetical protein